MSSSEDVLSLMGTFLQNAKKPLIVLLGPTASGKTDLSLKIAKAEGAIEIINADSRQLYRCMDIGTGKISQEEMAGIPHHLFSVLNPEEEVTIAWYQREAMRIIGEIHGRGHVPMLVGGSMLYISGIIDGLEPVASDSKLRKELSDAYDQDDGKTLHERLSLVDTESASAISQRNKVYLIRALEIFETTGKPKSALRKKEKSPFDLFIIGIDVPREELQKRIRRRVEKMFEAGWIDEVKNLLARDYELNDSGMKSLGYSEIAKALEDGSDPRKLIDVIERKTLQYAKRQRTWWRGDGRIQWMSGTGIPARDSQA